MIQFSTWLRRPQGGRIRAYADAFVRGLVGVSWVGTIGALVTCVMILVTLSIVITPTRFMHMPARFMSDPKDAFPFLKADVLRIAADPRPQDMYRVVIIGDSGIREAITNVPELRHRIARHSSRPVEIIPLVAGGLTQLDAVDLCGMLHDHMRGQVILEVSPYWMSKGHDQALFNSVMDRMGIDNADLADELQRSGYPRPLMVSNFFLRNFRFMLARTDAFVRLLRPFPQPPLHDPKRIGVQTDADFNRGSTRIYRMMHGFHSRSPDQIDMYNRMIWRLKKSGIQVTLLETPLNPRLFTGRTGTRGLTTPIMALYQKACKDIIRQTHVAIWDLDRESHLSATDFDDAYHIDRDAARERFTAALAKHIVAALAPPVKAKAS